MKTRTIIRYAFIPALCACAFAIRGVAAVLSSDALDEVSGAYSKELKVTADRISADRNSLAMTATGHVCAVSHPTRILSESLSRDTNGVCRLGPETSVTTCTNAQGHLHWEMRGEVEYKDGDYILMRNMTLRFIEVPVFWWPYLYYSMKRGFDVEIMPGYTRRWGGYLMTKYSYMLYGDPEDVNNPYWLGADTRFDLRWEQGIAFGQAFNWNLGDWGSGKFNLYYAWDQSVEKNYGSSGYDEDGYNYRNWGSAVPKNRYGMSLEHALDVTERDRVRLRGEIYSDTFFTSDFRRRELLIIQNKFGGFLGNEVAWEHNENLWGGGVSVSGPLNDFVPGISRLPEIYFDLSPTPVWKLPINYETQNRIGYLKRSPAEYASAGSELSAFSYSPGIWADYETFRFDTYHRLTAPFRCWDVMSVVPRVGFHGTFWNKTGSTDLSGELPAASEGNTFRSILEGGITFAGRGQAWISDDWQHVIEPYADVLAQKAWYANLGTKRPYVFDSIDASCDWEDQFAGRSRNLPYSYYGVTPGLRNAFRKVDELGHARTLFDFDVYAAFQANSASWYGVDKYRKLAEVGSPNYGKSCAVMPGARLRWKPRENMGLGARAEVDCENSTLALAEVNWTHHLSRKFTYSVSYGGRDHRIWDYSNALTLPDGNEDYNWLNCSFVQANFTHEICDMFAWAPYIRWDCRYGELDEVGAWFDVYRTDCLGFRIVMSYENEYTRVDGSTYEDEFSVGFYIYLRAIGASSGVGFSN